jgi:FkbM family methyltransferase
MEKILFIAPHLSTGGMPQYLLKQIESIMWEYEVHVVEWADVTGGIYVVQRNAIKELIGDRFYTLGEKKEDLFQIIDRISPSAIHFHEIPETFIGRGILEVIYRDERTYGIVVTTHSSLTNPDSISYTADKFVLVSEWSMDRFVEYYGDAIPCEIWEYPIEDLHNEEIDAKKMLGWDPTFKHVLNVGLFTKGKNQGELFELARMFEKDKVIFHFVGNQAVNFKDYWEPLMKQKPSNCIVHGERSDVALFYQAADLFYFCSNFELNPLSVKEALGHGIPTFIKRLHTYKDSYDGKVTYITADQASNKKKVIEMLNGIDPKFDFTNFDWGKKEPHPNFKETIVKEIVSENIYERFFFVEEGDLVVDIGASIGPFAYSILHKNPSRVFCIEPSDDLFGTLVKNMEGAPVTCINRGISKIDSDEADGDFIFGQEIQKMRTICFKSFMEQYEIERIDFLKLDCEGGEYDIFTLDNEEMIRENVSKIVGEWHLGTPALKEKFREFRNVYLLGCEDYRVFSVDGVDIKWDIWSDRFIDYYTEVIIYIDNRIYQEGC